MASDQLQETRQRNVESYIPEIPAEMFSPSMRTVLREYSKIPDEQVDEHILKIRDRAWDIFPYRCIGHFSFLQLSIGDAPQYAEVLQRVKNGERYLDIGCNFGQDLRKLVFDGAPAENLCGSDLDSRFFALGYDLFQDAKSLQSTFIAADGTAESSALDQLQGKISIIHAASYFHLFDRPTQIRAAVRCISLLRKQPGSLIFGRQGGSLVAQERTVRNPEFAERSRTLFSHNEESWREMWDEIAALTGTKWRVETIMYEDEMTRAMANRVSNREGGRRLRFAMWME